MKKILKYITMILSVFILITYCIYKNKEIKSQNKKINKFKQYYEILNFWLKATFEGKSIEKVIMQQGYKTIAIYGMGEIGQRLFENLKNTDIEVAYIIDEGVSYFDELEIKNIGDELSPVDLIVITPIFDYEIISKKLSFYYQYKICSIKDIIDLL